MISEVDSEDLVLPEQEFRYIAGSQERPWKHFTGRWQAMRPILERMFAACGTERPLRLVDVGSCTGFFSLQAAYRHAEADIIAIEGSVGIGNGTLGLAGSARQILSTSAVQTHLRWIQRLRLPNCFVAPEVWDLKRITELASGGRPICDVMFMLSVVHHIDNCSMQQYADAGLTAPDGFIELMGRLLLLSPRHFVELPNRPWLAAAYDTYGTQRAILEAAAAASGRGWSFKGPIYTTEWFGQRELWVMEAKTPMPPLDLQSSPFLLLYQGEEQELAEAPDDPLNDFGSLDAYGARSAALCRASSATEEMGTGGLLDSAIHASGDPSSEGTALGLPLPGAMGEDTAILGDLVACKALGGIVVDPGLMNLSGIPCPIANPKIAEAVAGAPTDLLVAHLTLREAITEAEELLSGLRGAGALPEHGRQRQGAQQHRPPPRQPPPPPPAPPRDQPQQHFVGPQGPMVPQTGAGMPYAVQQRHMVTQHLQPQHFQHQPAMHGRDLGMHAGPLLAARTMEGMQM